jgi:hypothetical protein
LVASYGENRIIDRFDTQPQIDSPVTGREKERRALSSASDAILGKTSWGERPSLEYSSPDRSIQ